MGNADRAARTFLVLVYDASGHVTERLWLGAETRLLEIPANTWHSVLSLDEGGVIFEVKHGAYQPVQEQLPARHAARRRRTRESHAGMVCKSGSGRGF